VTDPPFLPGHEHLRFPNDIAVIVDLLREVHRTAIARAVV
jgi:hypothetical protein